MHPVDLGAYPDVQITDQATRPPWGRASASTCLPGGILSGPPSVISRKRMPVASLSPFFIKLKRAFKGSHGCSDQTPSHGARHRVLLDYLINYLAGY